MAILAPCFAWFLGLTQKSQCSRAWAASPRLKSVLAHFRMSKYEQLFSPRLKALLTCMQCEKHKGDVRENPAIRSNTVVKVVKGMDMLGNCTVSECWGVAQKWRAAFRWYIASDRQSCVNKHHWAVSSIRYSRLFYFIIALFFFCNVAGDLFVIYAVMYLWRMYTLNCI